MLKVRLRISNTYKPAGAGPGVERRTLQQEAVSRAVEGGPLLRAVAPSVPGPSAAPWGPSAYISYVTRAVEHPHPDLSTWCPSSESTLLASLLTALTHVPHPCPLPSLQGPTDRSLGCGSAGCGTCWGSRRNLRSALWPHVSLISSPQTPDVALPSPTALAPTWPRSAAPCPPAVPFTHSPTPARGKQGWGTACRRLGRCLALSHGSLPCLGLTLLGWWVPGRSACPQGPALLRLGSQQHQPVVLTRRTCASLSQGILGKASGCSSLSPLGEVLLASSGKWPECWASRRAQEGPPCRVPSSERTLS